MSPSSAHPIFLDIPAEISWPNNLGFVSTSAGPIFLGSDGLKGLTYDILVFALEYRKAVDTMTGAKKNNLRKFEMGEDEWKVAGELCRVLKVSTGNGCHPTGDLLFLCFPDDRDTGIQGRNAVLLALDA
jgi:hypothetical protein